MTQNDDAAERAPRSLRPLSDPWTQGALTGALTLIPARKYPDWLRSGIIWSPTLAGAAGLALLAASWEEAAGKQTDAPTVLRAAAAGAAGGAVASAVLAASFWADGKIEHGLRSLGLRFPRVLMGAASGAATAWMVTQENRREAAQQSR